MGHFQSLLIDHCWYSLILVEERLERETSKWRISGELIREASEWKEGKEEVNLFALNG
jgi:hypothetical protein